MAERVVNKVIEDLPDHRIREDLKVFTVQENSIPFPRITRYMGHTCDEQ